MINSLKLVTLIVFLYLIQFSFTSIAEVNPAYKINKMKENVYRFTSGNHHSVFMVTEKGIVLTDPINEDAAKYLKNELRKRFKVPFLYMVYSHNHFDHIMGGHIFAEEGVTVVAHKYAAEDIKRTKLPTALPDLTFHDELTLVLGDSSVELKYHGPNNGRGSVSMRFMPANVLFVVDWIVIGRMPYKDLPGYDIHGMISSTREVLHEKPFDLFIGGHANTGRYEDVERYLLYIETLYNAVRDGMLAGKDLETLKSEIRLSEFSDLINFEEWMPLNIEGVYRNLVDMSYFNRRPDVK